MAIEDQGTPSPSVSYTANTAGSDTFKFRANDGNSDSTEVTVTIEQRARRQRSARVRELGGAELEVGQPTRRRLLRRGGRQPHDHDHPAAHEGHARDRRPGDAVPSVDYTATTAGADTFKLQGQRRQLGLRGRDGHRSTNIAAVNDAPGCLRKAARSRSASPLPPATASTRRATTSRSRSPQQPTKGTVQVVDKARQSPEVTTRPPSAGADTFKFKANDGTSDSNEETVTTTTSPARTTRRSARVRRPRRRRGRLP